MGDACISTSHEDKTVPQQLQVQDEELQQQQQQQQSPSHHNHDPQIQPEPEPQPNTDLKSKSAQTNSTNHNTQTMDFFTFGMFILDEIQFSPPREPVLNVVGGGGTFASVGARLFSPSPGYSKSIGWIVHEGSDFPEQVRSTIEQWNTSCLFRETPDRLTTRGWNRYGDNEERAFRYLTPKMRINADSLTPELFRSRSFHLICSPTRCIDIVKDVLSERRVLGEYNEPVFVWEPVPDLATAEELENCIEALKYVDVVSPNHAELCQFFGREHEAYNATGNVRLNVVQECIHEWLKAGIGKAGKGAAVVRMGKEGCIVFTRDQKRVMPAFHGPDTAHMVIDPTGGGNMFLGGFTTGMARLGPRHDFETFTKAAIWGTIAASFAIEQIGMPGLTFTDDGEERWNGDSVEERVTRFNEKLKVYVQPLL